jgi:hypothetical protein|tara:strand:+ start:178 stop:420 length:243 start_codon:yes stop_codon:yes gene_type:complete
MDKVKEYMMITVMATVILIMTGVAKADETTTFGDFVSAWASVPGKIINHVKAEAVDIKEHQKKSWADAKTKWPFNKISSD